MQFCDLVPFYKTWHQLNNHLTLIAEKVASMLDLVRSNINTKQTVILISIKYVIIVRNSGISVIFEKGVGCGNASLCRS